LIFNGITRLKALNKVCELLGNYYWRVDPDGKIYVEARGATSSGVTFSPDNENILEGSRVTIDIYDLKNRVYVWGGDPENGVPLYVEENDTTNQAIYGVKEAEPVILEGLDLDNLNAYADALLAKSLAARKRYLIRTYMDTSLKPGLSVVVDPDGDGSGDTLTITSITFYPEKSIAEVELEEDISADIVAKMREIENFQQEIYLQQWYDKLEEAKKAFSEEVEDELLGTSLNTAFIDFFEDESMIDSESTGVYDSENKIYDLTAEHAFQNPSFETGDASGWTLTTSNINGGFSVVTDWKTDGSYSLRCSHGFILGDPTGDADAYQVIDLTDVDQILFDFRQILDKDPDSLGGFGYVQVYIDDTKVYEWGHSIDWNSPGVRYDDVKTDQSIDVSGYTGMHTVKFRWHVNHTGVDSPTWYFWLDNIRAYRKKKLETVLIDAESGESITQGEIRLNAVGNISKLEMANSVSGNVIDPAFDNSGGGSWADGGRIKIIFDSALSEAAQYKIVINGDNIEVYNSSGTLKKSGTGAIAQFWNKVNSDGSDIRVANQDIETPAQRYFWIENFNSAGQSAVIWVRAESGDSEISIFCGNSSATMSSYNDPNSVFGLCDDFESYPLGGFSSNSIWTVIQESYKAIEIIDDGGQKSLRIRSTDTGGGYDHWDGVVISQNQFSGSVLINAQFGGSSSEGWESYGMYIFATLDADNEIYDGYKIKEKNDNSAFQAKIYAVSGGTATEIGQASDYIFKNKYVRILIDENIPRIKIDTSADGVSWTTVFDTTSFTPVGVTGGIGFFSHGVSDRWGYIIVREISVGSDADPATISSISVEPNTQLTPNWEEVTEDTVHTFTNTGSLIKARIWGDNQSLNPCYLTMYSVLWREE